MSLETKIIRGRNRKDKKEMWRTVRSKLDKIFPIKFEGPLCKICGLEFAKYDDVICESCKESMKRLKNI